MPDNPESEAPKGEPRTPVPPAQAISPTAPPNAPPPQTAQEISSAGDEKQRKNLEDRVHRAEKWMIGLTGAVAFFALCSVVVGILQWGAMNGQLREMRSGGTDTHDLAVVAKGQAESTQHLADNMKTQADRTKDLADRMKEQADQTRTIAAQAVVQANAAQSAAQTAKDALHISQGAYIVNGNPQIDWNRKVIFIPIENRGHIPSGQVHIILHITQITRNPGGGSSVQMKWTDSWLKSMTDTAPITSPQVSFDPEQARNGIQVIHLGLEIDYYDGFLGTPQRTTEATFCSVHETSSLLFGPCLGTNMLEMMKQGDQYPKPKYYMFPVISDETLQPPIPTN